MSKIKIHILYSFKEGSWGGGNQFLKALKKYLEKNGLYAEEPDNADVVLFNSHHQLKELLSIKKKMQNKIFIHRVDGPISLYRGRDYYIDETIFSFNNTVADGTIFQSKWSKNESYKLGMKNNMFETVIMNAPDIDIFHPSLEEKKERRGEKVKLIATSWSDNPRKGFDIYEFLDKNLDFSQYSMTFVGRSQINFKNINHIDPVPSIELANILRNHDIFITGSQHEPCSNSLIEALHCGLPAVVRNSGSNPEIVGNNGKIFNDVKDVLKAIDEVTEKMSNYKKNIELPDINTIGNAYYSFCLSIFEAVASNLYKVKSYNRFKYFKLLLKSKKL